MISTTGRVFERGGQVYILTNRPAVDNLSDEVEVRWQDKRLRSLDQIHKAFALMADIGREQGESEKEVYEEQKLAFSIKEMDALNGMLFGLSTATMSEASMFIDFLIALIVEHGISTSDPLYKMCEDIEHYVYACLLNKKCAICGRKAELHHVDAVGMGYNRREKPQIGALVLPLAKEYHMECHNIGNKAFCEKYHLEPVRLDERLANVYGLTEKARREGNYGQV